MPDNHQQIAILDFGSQYTHLIARRFRQLGVLAKLYPPSTDVSKIENLIGIVISGGPGSTIGGEGGFNYDVFKSGLPVLGLCFGHQLMATHFGGKVETGQTGEYGKTVMQVGESILFNGLEGGEVVWMSHEDSVVKLPEGFKIIGSTDHGPITAMANEEAKMFGLQFHPEVTHTDSGMKILENFAYNICQAKKDWDLKDWSVQIIKQIQTEAKGKKVFLLVSGGVDSTVCFSLLNKALGPDKVYGLHIDTGFMRKDEVEQVQSSMANAGFDNLHIKDASEYFLNKVVGITDPEEKRKIIGTEFIEVKEQVSNELNLNPEEWMLAQGTIYPDTIESGGTDNADTIKTHHNRVDKIQDLINEGKLIEPIKELYKDEVRELGELLGLPEKLVWRQPFPGPGLAIRCLCNSDYGKVENKLDKYDADVLPIKSVGVQGDFRTYAHPAVITTQNIDWLELEKLSPEITNSSREVNRVLIEVSNSKAQVSSGELIKASITKERLDLLREVDAIVQEEMFKAGLEHDIWQFPVVLVPFGIDNKESIVLRPVSSLEAMTAKFYPLEQAILDKIVAKIEALNQVSFIFYDITNKPPGTIEWE